MRNLTRRGFVAVPFVLSSAVSAFALSSADEWKDSDTLQPKALAARITANEKNKPLILQVGFAFHYKNKHIPGAVYAGPGNKPEGQDRLKAAVAGIAKDREIILYCGCCPWEKCPNMKPSFAWLREAGFKNVKAVIIEKDFGTNWVDLGYPVENGS